MKKRKIWLVVTLFTFVFTGVVAEVSAQTPEVFVPLGHADSITSAVFSTDGAYLISSSKDRTVKIWEGPTGREVRTLSHDAEVNAIHISPDGKTIISGDDKGKIHFWETLTGKYVGKIALKEGGNKIYSLSYSPDGKNALATDYFRLFYLDAIAKKLIFVLDRSDERFTKGLGAQIKAAAFMKDSRRLVLGINYIDDHYKNQGIGIEIYDVKKKKGLKIYKILSGDFEINNVAVSPDETHFLVSVMTPDPGDKYEKRGKLLVIDARNGALMREFSYPKPFYQVLYSPNGSYAAAANFHEVIIYETNQWQEVQNIKTGLPIAFSPDGKSLIYGNSNAWTYYERWVFKEGLDLIDIKTGNKITRYGTSVDGISSAYFAAGDREIHSGHLLLLNWDREKGTLNKPLMLKDAENRIIAPYAASRNGKHLIFGNDYGMYIYDTGSHRLKKMWEKPLFRPDFTPDGKVLLFSTYDRRIILWDVENNRQIRQLTDWGPREKLFIQFNKISPDGRYAVVLFDEHEKESSHYVIVIWEVESGREVNRYVLHNGVFSLIISPDSRHILTGEVTHRALGDPECAAVLRSITENRVIRKFPGHKDMIRALAFSRNGDFIITGGWDQQIILWETKTGKKIKTFSGHAGIVASLDFSSDGKYFVSTSSDGTVRLWDVSAGREVAQFITFVDGEWIVITPEGYFNSSPGGAKHISLRIGNRVFPIDNLYEKFFSPVYIASVLQGKKVEAIDDIRRGIKPPPDIRIISPLPNTRFKADTITIKVAAKDMGGGIDEIRLYHNGKALGDDQRGLKLVGVGAELVRDYTVTLVDGLNTFQVVGFSKDRTQSNPVEIAVLLEAPPRNVSLYVFVVGINKYKNPALNLNYAVHDARAIASFFRGRGGLFKNVNVIEIYDEEATKANILTKLKDLEMSNPQDVVVIYLAGHGENVSDIWYFIPHELTYPEREEYVRSQGISSADLAAALKKIRAQKILLLVDACKSGAVLVAFRGFEDRKALSQLSRSTGTHVVAASTKDQFAAEVKELGHGVFTYTLLEGLKGKAAGESGTVTVRKLMGYIEEHLPEITKKYKQEAQFPVVDSRGMDFPLVQVNR